MAANEQLARDIIRILCRLDCCATVEELQNHLADQQIKIDGGANKLVRFIENYPETLAILPGQKTKGKLVCINTQVPLCSDHCMKNGQCSREFFCNGLHICKFFLLSECGRKNCSFGHIIQTEHNNRVLAPYLLDRLDDHEIKSILSNIRNRTPLTKPELCKFYNTSQGCTKSNCPFLHLCRHFVTDTCKFEERCKRSHNVASPENINILRKYGIDVDRSIDYLLSDLKIMFESCDHALSRYGSASSLNNLGTVQSYRSLSAAGRRSNQRRRSPSPGPRQGPFFRIPPAVLSDMCPGPMAFSGARPKTTATSSFQRPDFSQVPPPTQRLGPKALQGQSLHYRQGQDNERPAFSSQSSKEKEKQQICLYNLKGKCWYGHQCVNVHKDMIYQWQYRLEHKNNWEDFESDVNMDLETNYCQPDKDECFVKLNDIVVKVSFTEPMTGSGQIKMAVRRLSTISSKAPNSLPATFQWSTEWKWYWEGPLKEWILYGNQDLQGSRSSWDSETIEEKYLQDPNGFIEFETDQFQYKLDFSSMTQQNTKLNTTRRVVRRPLFFKKEDLAQRKLQSQSQVAEVPQNWSVQKFSTQKMLLNHYQENQVDKFSEEYRTVADLFSATMPRDTIRSITRIESGDMWSSYSLKKGQMTTKAGKQVTELQLFHGTDENYIKPICHQGFDFRFSGSRVGTRYGRGSYFARDSEYSSKYTTSNSNGHAKMFVAKVLVGEYALGDSTCVRPPPKSSRSAFELYDSCVDSTTDPSIYVVFTLEQAYPEYLIEFKKKTL